MYCIRITNGEPRPRPHSGVRKTVIYSLAKNTMKNTFDGVDYIIKGENLSIYYQ